MQRSSPRKSKSSLVPKSLGTRLKVKQYKSYSLLTNTLPFNCLPSDELEGDLKVQRSTNTVCYKTTQLHTSDTTTDITPQLPSREYLKDEDFMKELTSSNDRAIEGEGIAELEPENKVYQPLIPPRLHELEEGGSNTDYQPLTYPEKTNDETTNENAVYEPVPFTAEQCFF